MPDPYRKVNPGDDLEFPASTWNSILDAAKANQARGGAPGKDGSFRQATIVRVKNESGEDLNRNQILGLDGPIFTPTDSQNVFLERVTFRGIKPDITKHKRRYVVLLDPARDGSFARGYLSGVCQVKVDVADQSHEFAIIDDENFTNLKSSRHGHAQILWRESDEEAYGYDTGVQWTIVRLGVTMSCFAIGKANGGISARSGGTYGTGTVDIYRSVSGHEDGPVESVSVLNASADTMTYGGGIDDGRYCSVAWDADGVAWVAPLECPDGPYT